MGPFEIHVFVCTSGTVCPVETDSRSVHARLKELVKGAGLSGRIRVNNSGCMDQCGHGPMIAVYPENIWYCLVTLADADAIFHEHLVGGRPVERLMYHPQKPGANKIARTHSTSDETTTAS
jgi:(2Fe-2S) ferredoxin